MSQNKRLLSRNPLKRLNSIGPKFARYATSRASVGALTRCGLPTLSRSSDCQLFRGGQDYGWLEKYYQEKVKQENLEQWWKDSPALPPTDDPLARPKAWLEFSVLNEVVGKVVVELAKDILPQTTKNFLRLCDGVWTRALNMEKKLQYKGTAVHQIYKSKYLLMGDVLKCNGRGGHSALGTRFFKDEGFFIRHSKPGMLSMAQSGKDLNSSIFFFTLKPLPHLDGRNVCFGSVVEGMPVLEKLGAAFQVKGVPVNKISVSDCGIVN